VRNISFRIYEMHTGDNSDTRPSRGAFNFSQSIIPLLLASSRSTNLTASEIQYPPTLIFTGATASTKASAKFSNFTPGKFALRSLSQSIAKEFGPQGIHVGHAIIDGVINTELTKGWMAGAGPDAKVNPEAVRTCALGLFHLGQSKKLTRNFFDDRLPMSIGICTPSLGVLGHGRSKSGRTLKNGRSYHLLLEDNRNFGYNLN